MTVRRVALIYDDTARPDTTGVYCRRAFGALLDVEHVLPTELARLPRDGFDLYLNVDDGLRYRLLPDLRPCAWWAIDTHLDPDWYREKAPDFDWVFAAQRDGALALRDAGIDGADWLPLACDPEVHRRHYVPKRHDVTFIGNLFPGPRSELLGLLRRTFRDTLVANRYFEEMAEAYSASRLVFNRSLRNDVNMRVFEAAACGSLLLTNDLSENGQDELFHDGVHLATYADAEELLDKAAYYLKHEDVREAIAAQGMAEAHARHTYRHRMEGLLAEVEVRLSRAVVPAPIFERVGPPSPSPSVHDPVADPEGLLALVPAAARRVLDVGCGDGRLGGALKARRDAEVVGIERDEAAARRAEGRLDRVLVADIEAIEPDFAPGSFDAVVCGGALPQLRDPARFLRWARGWLRPGGALVVAVPNVRHLGTVGALLDGSWTYGAEGPLRPDCLRCYTRRELEKALFRAGFVVERLQAVPGPSHEEWSSWGRPGEVRVGRLHVAGLDPDEAEEFYAAGFRARAVPREGPGRGTTSIVVLTHNQFDYTRRCLESLERFTDEPYELIVVDNASTDGTVEFLGGRPGVRLIENAENRGFPAAANQGIAASTGDQVLLLNNDTVVTTGWLHRMLRALHADPRVGLVGPCSNFVAGEQQVPVGYDDLAALDGFAWDWGKAHDGLVEETDRLIGFCLLIRRAVVEQVGLLDERFGVGCYEDDDYCLRAIRAGWRAVIARDAFVHHFGSRTFVGSGVDFAALMAENDAKFRAKWAGGDDGDGPGSGSEILAFPAPALAAPTGGAVADTAPPSPLAVVAAPGGGLLLTRERVRLSFCMIVRDNAQTIRPCLESVRPWVDELVVVDTGSVDETPRVVQEYGARLFHFPWCDDFAAARNESLRHARGEWLFWMDSDDTIPPDCGRRLRDLAYSEVDPAILGLVAQVHCPGDGEDGGFDVTAVDHVKLIRNRPELRFDGRIHEQLLPAIRRAGGEVAWTDLYVVHSGSDRTEEGQDRKRRRDLRLLELELAERPGHPFTLFNLGMTYADGGRHEEAVEYLGRSIAASGPGESHLRKAYALRMYAEMQLGRLEEARETCRRGLELFPEDAELQFRRGVLLHELGCPAEAARAYREVLANAEERHFSSLDRGIVGFKARQNLAVVLAELGDLEGAEAQWRAIVAEVPGYRTGWRGLGDALLSSGRPDRARELSERLLCEPGLEAEGLLLAGRVAAGRGDVAAARAALEEAAAERPDDPEPLRILGQVLFEAGDGLAAERVLRELAARCPDDAATHHNLGTLYLRARRFDEAAAACRESLRHRPGSTATLRNLGHALEGAGRRGEAVAAWEELLRLDPADAQAREALGRARGEKPQAGPASGRRRRARRAGEESEGA